MSDINIVLASGSPRRREMLKKWGVKTISADIDESFPEGTPVPLAIQQIAARKAAAAAKNIDENALVIGADTIVYSEGKILGKPKDEEDAFCMLSALSGKMHEVMTGVAVLRTSDAKLSAFCEHTRVFFKELTDVQIRDYIKTGEPMDKAGAYGIQGLGGALVDHIEGDYDNVVGLPLTALLKLMKDEFDFEGEE